MAHDVFVSYSSKDKSVGDAVSVALESHGLSCWIAPRDILPSNDWGGSIIEAIEEARVMVLIFSASANASVQIKREVERAVTKGKPIIPFRIENVAPRASLEYFISTPQWLDAFTPPLERHLEYLAKVVRRVVGGPEISISPLVPETEPREKAEAEEARIAEEKRKVAEATEAARVAKETRKAEDREKKEAAERAKLADEKQKAAEAVEAEKPAEKQRKVALGKIAATDPTKRRATIISKLASAVSTQLIQRPRLQGNEGFAMSGNEPPQSPSEPKSAVQSVGRLLDLLCELSVCGFSLCMVVLGGVVFLYVEQGKEVLRGLAERGDQTGATNVWRIVLFGFGLFVWSVASWYSARVLLDCEFFKGRERPLPKNERWSEFREKVRLEFPRILGVLPFAIVGTGFLLCTFRYESTAPWGLKVLCAVCYAGGVLMYFALRARRKFINRHYDKANAEEEKTRISAELKGYSRMSIRIIGAISVLFALLLVINPIVFAGGMGTGAVLVLAGAAWVFWGSVLVYFGQRVHLPLLVLAVFWVAFCSLTNDNHDLRTVTPTKDYTRPKLSDALKDWHEHVAKKYPGRVHPLYIVASEGGGIRAAYWTAAVLGTIQDEQPAFADHVFAISGVSGGSLGAAVFASLLPDGHDRKDFARRAESMLGRDFLSPAMAAMLCPDFLQRFWPWGYTWLDRGRWVERSWENAWRDTMQKAGTKNPNRFAESFLDLWRADDDYVPNLCLNGTSVERGKRVIATNLLISWQEFLDADDAIERLMPLKDQGKDDRRARPGVDLPLSAAAHLSARFTYVSPAGKFPPDGTHVVDGGYFENSGATTALDILREITREMGRAGSDLGDTVPKLIMISNNPTANAPLPAGAKKKMTVTTAAEQGRSEPSTFLEDAMAPVDALLHTRDARGTYAQRAIGHAQEIFYENLKGTLPPNQEAKVYYFSLAPAEVPLPLGWMLSNRAAHAMHLELNDEGKSITTPVETWNKFVREQIIASLPPPVPTAVASPPSAPSR